MNAEELQKLARLIRYYILLTSTTAGSGHPTSSLSATDLLTVLFFKYFRFDLDNPENPANDRLIFSKGHASPLYYSLFAAAGKISEAELLKYRTFDSVLEGHPTRRFAFTEVSTGSLGQGLGVGVGEALALHLQSKSPRKPCVYVLLGDGEMAEGSMWEAIQSSAYYKLNNLVAILDVNRLGQSVPTMLEHDIDTLSQRIEAFGWNVIKVQDGHDVKQIDRAFAQAESQNGKPTMIIAKTIKGKGVSALEDKNGWHGKPLPKDQFEAAVKELGEVDKKLVGKVQLPESKPSSDSGQARMTNVPYTSYKVADEVATRKAYGTALVRLGKIYPDLVALDGDVKNSTYSEDFEKVFSDRFFQLFIAEQNMVSVAAGMARRGLRPFVSTFACFLTRAADQIRMAALSGVAISFCGSHAGVSIGEDGPSQMGLEDLSLFRAVLGSIVVYPVDAVATEKLLELLYQQQGISYMRTTRPGTKVLYSEREEFTLGGSKEFKVQGSEFKVKDSITVVAAGITVYEALKAQEQLKTEGIAIRVIDCYSIKPIDRKTLEKVAAETKAIITVEDHYAQGGLGDAVLEVLADQPKVPVYKLAVTKLPRSGKPAQLLDYEEISAGAIAGKVKSLSK